MDIRQDSSSLRIDLLLIVHSQDKQTGGDKSEEPVPPRQAVKPAPRKPHTSGQIISGYESQESHVRLQIHPKTSKSQLLNRPTATGAPVSTNNGNSWDPTPQPSAKDFYAYPWDKSNLKSLAMNLKNFEKLDAYSAKVGKPSTVEQLVSSLLKMARTDLERVRAIWTWICHHIEYDLDGMEDKSKRSGDPNQTLLTGKGACEGYAGLFENMCSHAGIQCLKIGGFSKGFCYRMGQTFSEEPNHAWNAVFLNKRWHLVDTTWGAGFANSSTNSFKFRYNEFYFLTHPALFIEEHFPDNQNWQLLQVPLSMKQFEGNLCRNSNFYNAGLTASYPETLMVETVNGKATFSIEGHCPALFSFTLNKTEKPGIMTLTKNGMQLDVYPTVTGQHKLELYTKPFNPGKESYDKVVEYILHCGSVDTGFRIPKELDPIVGPSWLTEIKGFLQHLCSNPIINTQDGCCSVGFTLAKKATVLATLHSDNIKPGDENRYVLQTLRGNRVEFKVHLPQKGFYALKIHSSCGPLTFECFCNYLVVCTNPEVAWPPFPRQLQNPVGPTALMEKRGLLQPSQRDPIIYTSGSHCSLSFTLKEDIKILTSMLFDETPLTDHGGKRLVIQTQKGSHVEIQIYLPQAGAYILQIFANSKTSPTSFEYVCNYLICCSNTEVEGSESLVTALSTLNSANPVDKNGFMRHSKQGQVIESPDGRCSLSFSLDREESCLATLHCDDSKWNKQMERRYIMYTQKHRHVEFYIQLPKSGSYELRIYVDNRSQPGSYEFVSGYIITCNNPDVAWPPFPNKLQSPVGPTALSEKKGLVQPSHTNPIIDSTEGHCSFSFTLKKEMGIFARLQSDDVNLTEEAERRHVLQVQRQNKVEFQVQLPQSGTYVLKIYTESEQGSYKFACNYLINCTNTKVTWPLLPVELNNPVGPTIFSEKKGLVRPSLLEPVIYTDDGCCSVSFGLNDSIDVVATLHADDITSEEVRRRHVFQVIKDGYVEFLTRLPKAGTYVLKICTKKKSDPGNMYDYTCNYLLCCSNPNVRWPFFPMRYNAWDFTYELLEPLNGILPANSPVHFKIKARGLAAVLVKGLNLCPLTLNSDGYWEGTCNTQGSQDIHVMLTNNLNKNYALVLSYKVNNTDSQGS